MQQQSARPKRRLHKEPVSIEIEPRKLSFTQFQISKTHINKFTIRNKSERRQPVRILGPHGDNAPFTLKYDDRKLIESNEEMEVYVYFKPQENRFYSQHLEIMLGNTCNKVELTAFSMPIYKRPSKTLKMLSKEKSEQIHKADSSGEISSNEDVETSFLRRCRELANHRLEKSIKNETCVGNVQPSESEKEAIRSQRVSQQTDKLNQWQNKIQTRYDLQLSHECLIHDWGSNKIVKWDQSKNSPSMNIKHSLRKFQTQILNIIKDERFEKVRRALLPYMELDLTKEEIFLRMEQDIRKTSKHKSRWKRGENIQMPQFAQFSKFSVRKRVIPSENDNLASLRNYSFDVEPRVSFDDWMPTQEMPENSHEVMRYEHYDEPEMVIHSPLLQLNFREGAEEEYPFRQNKFQLGEYPLLTEVEELGYHQFLPNSYLETLTVGMEQLTDLPPKEMPQICKKPGCSFHGLNFELFNYIKEDSISPYDVGFYSNIEDSCPTLLGGVTLEDKITEHTKLDLRSSKIDTSLLRKIKPQQNFSESQGVGEILHNISFSMGELKRQKLLTFNGFISGCNSVISDSRNRLNF